LPNGKICYESSDRNGILYEDEQCKVPYRAGVFSGTSIVIEGASQPNLYEIIPNLYLGSQDAAFNTTDLDLKKCHYILNVATGIENGYPDRYIYQTTPILDIEEVDITTEFPKCFEFIRKGIEHGGVLVHCNAGVSRSASVVIGYLMNVHKLTYQEAYEMTKKSKSDIRPNPGFVKALLRYEQTLKQKDSESKDNISSNSSDNNNSSNSSSGSTQSTQSTMTSSTNSSNSSTDSSIA